MALTAAVSPNSFPQSSTGRLEERNPTLCVAKDGASGVRFFCYFLAYPLAAAPHEVITPEESLSVPLAVTEPAALPGQELL
jgi:hypothetical protein